MSHGKIYSNQPKIGLAISQIFGNILFGWFGYEIFMRIYLWWLWNYNPRIIKVDIIMAYYFHLNFNTAYIQMMDVKLYCLITLNYMLIYKKQLILSLKILIICYYHACNFFGNTMPLILYKLNYSCCFYRVYVNYKNMVVCHLLTLIWREYIY